MTLSLKNFLAVFVGALSLVAGAKHYSFVGGYPASGVTAERAKVVESGGASVGGEAGTKTRKVAVAEKVVVGKVTKVSDGDTIWVEEKGRRVKVRMDRIDAPESDQKFGKESKEFLSGLIMGKEVEVRYRKKDQYGRILGIVFLRQGEKIVDVNLTMVLNGMAWHCAHFDKTPAYAQAHLKAREAKLGLWAHGDAVDPHEWRKRKRK